MYSKLTKEELTEIVKTYEYLANRAFADEYCWEADVGNMMTPVQFAETTKYMGGARDLVDNIFSDVVAHTTWLFNEYPESMSDREFSDVRDDILRDIVAYLATELEDM